MPQLHTIHKGPLDRMLVAQSAIEEWGSAVDTLRFVMLRSGGECNPREEGMASPKKLSHIVLQTNRRREMIDWYCTVLGAEILYEAERISFISYDDEHHRVAFLDPGPLTERQPDAAGLNHVAFTFGGRDDLIDNYVRLKEAGIRPHRCVNHGVTTSMYYHDPDHNQVELLVDNFATAAEGQAYMRGRSATDKNPVGVVYEPEELMTRVRAGLRLKELASIN